jgi:hypothetical protein
MEMNFCFNSVSLCKSISSSWSLDFTTQMGGYRVNGTFYFSEILENVTDSSMQLTRNISVHMGCSGVAVKRRYYPRTLLEMFLIWNKLVFILQAQQPQNLRTPIAVRGS